MLQLPEFASLPLYFLGWTRKVEKLVFQYSWSRRTFWIFSLDRYKKNRGIKYLIMRLCILYLHQFNFSERKHLSVVPGDRGKSPRLNADISFLVYFSSSSVHFPLRQNRLPGILANPGCVGCGAWIIVPWWCGITKPLPSIPIPTCPIIPFVEAHKSCIYQLNFKKR